MADSDIEYYLQRAEQEAVLAIQADHPKATAVHQALSVRYSAKAAIAIAGADEEPEIMARHRKPMVHI